MRIQEMLNPILNELMDYTDELKDELKQELDKRFIDIKLVIGEYSAYYELKFFDMNFEKFVEKRLEQIFSSVLKNMEFETSYDVRASANKFVDNNGVTIRLVDINYRAYIAKKMIKEVVG